MQANISQGQDIFFTVKRQILDKLDLILQKINLQLLQNHPKKQTYTYIQLSDFEAQISTLFKYLDKLYASLNSSVSMSAYESVEVLKIQNQRLCKQNLTLKTIITDKIISIEEAVSISNGPTSIEQSNSKNSNSKKSLNLKRQSSNYQIKDSNSQYAIIPIIKQIFLKLQQQCRSINKMFKSLKKQLKDYKFIILEARVQYMSKIKQETSRIKEETSRINTQETTENVCFDCHNDYQDLSQIILHRIDQMLTIS